jgi:hypothetical protein
VNDLECSFSQGRFDFKLFDKASPKILKVSSRTENRHNIFGVSSSFASVVLTMLRSPEISKAVVHRKAFEHDQGMGADDLQA